MTADSTLRAVLVGLRTRIRTELHENVLPFWSRFGVDREHIGYHDHLDRDGVPFDTKKHVGLQAQALWVWSRLAADIDARPEWLAAARSGAMFLRTHAARGDGRVFSVTTRDGRPFAPAAGSRNELLVAAALCEWGRACGEPEVRVAANNALESALKLARESAAPGDPRLTGATAVSELDTVTLAIDALDSHERLVPESALEHEREWLARLALHVRPELDLLIENVSLDGRVLDGPEGRLVCPGRWLVAARQLFEHASRRADQRGVDQALTAMENALDFGWDGDDGGLYLYVDRDGYSPVQIEWSRKLAWVHGAALVATLTAYAATRAPRWLERFEQVADYTFTHFPDADQGEWFASLDRRNRVCQRFKAGPRKGGYAVARSLLRCEQLMAQVLD